MPHGWLDGSKDVGEIAATGGDMAPVVQALEEASSNSLSTPTIVDNPSEPVPAPVPEKIDTPLAEQEHDLATNDEQYYLDDDPLWEPDLDELQRLAPEDPDGSDDDAIPFDPVLSMQDGR